MREQLRGVKKMAAMMKMRTKTTTMTRMKRESEKQGQS